MTGTIKKIFSDRGFGFIVCENRDLFFHASTLRDGLEFSDQLIGQVVEFDPATHDGRERAVFVRPIEADLPQVRRHG